MPRAGQHRASGGAGACTESFTHAGCGSRQSTEWLPPYCGGRGIVTVAMACVTRGWEVDGGLAGYLVA